MQYLLLAGIILYCIFVIIRKCKKICRGMYCDGCEGQCEHCVRHNVSQLSVPNGKKGEKTIDDI